MEIWKKEKRKNLRAHLSIQGSNKKLNISFPNIFPLPLFSFFFSFFIKTQSLKISLAIQRNAEGINKPDNVGAFCKSESGRSGIIQVGRTRGNEEKRD